MDLIAKRIVYIVERIATVLFISLFLVVVLNIVLRNIFQASWLWIPGMSRLLFIWFVFMGTTVLYDRHEHLIMDFFVTKLSKGKRIKLEIFINLIFLCFNFVLVYYGIKVVGIRRGIPFGTWELSTAYAYAALPAAGLIMIYLCINKLRHYMKGEFYE